MHRVAGEFPALDSSPRSSGPTLLRRFTLLSLATTIVVGVLFGAITARLVEDFALRRHARMIADHALGEARSRLVLQDFLLSPPARRPQLDRAMADLVGKAESVHITIWNRLGQVLYSGGRAEFESLPAASTHLTLALDGQLQWRLVRSTRGGAGAAPPLLEVFVPVVASGISRPVAVFLILSDLSDLWPALTRLKWSVATSVVLGVLFLYVVLFTIVRRASGDLVRKERAQRQTFVGIIRSLVNALDARDMATAHHSSRVAEHAIRIARAMGLNEEFVSEVRVAGFLHDVGKIGIRDGILTKQGPLTAEESAMMQRHTVFGYDILDPVPLSERIKLAVRHSHERWDGRGYPDGLTREQIPLAARIVAVADAYEALTTNRPYRPARSPETATGEIRQGAGTQFDPQVVEVFLRVWQQSAPGEGVRAVPVTGTPGPQRSAQSVES